jgi:hypothetical protein
MTNLGRRLERLETRLFPQDERITHHIIRFVEGNGTVTGSMVINFDTSQREPRGWPIMAVNGIVQLLCHYSGVWRFWIG